MDELIKIHESNDNRYVDARDLWEKLQVGKDFSTWIKERIEKYGFVENVDFSPELGKSGGGRPKIEYLISMDMAKELAMVENNEQGRKIRRYFIEVEKHYRENLINPAKLSKLQILQWAVESEKKLLEQQPKVEAYEQFLGAKGSITIGEFAKIIGWGPNKLFEKLRELDILMSNDSKWNVPYQRYIDSGYFELKEKVIPTGAIKSVTLITPKGQEFVWKLLKLKKAE